jgi:hypothetical protein
MVGAGVAWGVYSLRGKGAGDPLATTAGNFLRAVPFAAGLSLLFLSLARADFQGVAPAGRIRRHSGWYRAGDSQTEICRLSTASILIRVTLEVSNGKRVWPLRANASEIYRLNYRKLIFQSPTFFHARFERRS